MKRIKSAKAELLEIKSSLLDASSIAHHAWMLRHCSFSELPPSVREEVAESMFQAAEILAKSYTGAYKAEEFKAHCLEEIAGWRTLEYGINPSHQTSPLDRTAQSTSPLLSQTE